MKSYGSIVVDGNSHAIRDSYTYTLKELLKLPPADRPTFDFVYLDGAHEWHHDGLAFLLIDLMLRCASLPLANTQPVAWFFARW